MGIEEEYMTFLEQDAYLFHLARDKVMMDIILKISNEGGKSAHQIAKEMNLDYTKVKKQLEDVHEKGFLEKTQAGPRQIYFLSFKLQKLVDLYNKLHA